MSRKFIILIIVAIAIFQIDCQNTAKSNNPEPKKQMPTIGTLI
jgi:hypothetical protein